MNPRNLTSGDSLALAREVDALCDRFEAALRRGEFTRLDAWLPLHNPLRQAALPELARVELEYRLRRGEPAQAEEYLARYPELAADPAKVAMLQSAARIALQGIEPRTRLEDTSRSCGINESPPVIAGYSLSGELLGAGGMGVVWRGRDVRLNREVAIKVLRHELRDSLPLARRFIEEAQVTSQLQHPGIPPVHELGTLPDGRPYFVMKVVKGRTLADLLGQRLEDADDLPRLLEVFNQVCQTVAYAHSKGVIHRDLKPGNVMVGSFGEVQVMDWGLAKVLTDEPRRERETRKGPPPGSVVETLVPTGKANPTEAGTVLGTYAYMPPEQARGEVARLDRRCDVFGLGAILCEILTRQLVYTGTWEEIKAQAVLGRLQPAWQRLEECGADADLTQLARSCLGECPEDRLADAGVVAHAVAAHQAAVEGRLRRAEMARAAAEARADEEARTRAMAQAKEEVERRARRLAVGQGMAALAALALAGGGMWLLHHREVDRRHDTKANLERAAELRDASRWKEAEAALENARLRLGEDGPTDLRDELAQARKDLSLARQLEEIRLRKATIVEGVFDNIVAADREYEQAFHQAGLAPADDPEAAAARIRRSAIPQQMLAALDDWAAGAPDAKRLAWLLEVARRADDPRHAPFRNPADWVHPHTLQRLAQEAFRVKAPPSLCAALTARLRELGPVNVSLLREAVACHPGDFWVHFKLANALRKKAPNEAIGYYWAALAIRPNTAAVYNNLANALHAAGDLPGALAAHDQAIRCDPTLGLPYHSLGHTLLASGNLDGAEAAFRKAVDRSPRDAMARYDLGNLLARAGNLPGALACYRHAILCDPHCAAAHANLGSALRQTGDLAGAIAAHQRAITCDPRLALAHYNLGVSLQAAGHRDGAIAAYHQAITLDPANAAAHFNLGLALREADDLPGAVGAYRQAIRQDPRMAPAHFHLGIALRASGDLSGAIASHRRAIACDPGLALAHYNLGNALREARDLPGAIAAYRQAVVCDPTLAAAHLNLGIALSDTRDFQGAMAAYRKAIAHNPKLELAHYNLGNACRTVGDLASALTAYRRAVEITPRLALAHAALARTLLDCGHFAEASTSAKTCLGLLKTEDPYRKDVSGLLAQCDRLSVLDRNLASVLAGKRKPVNAHERVALAELCWRYKKQYATAANFYADAFAARPETAADLRLQHRYFAACCAVLAAAGAGSDAKPLEIADRLALRMQAYAWLRADLTAWGDVLEREMRPRQNVIQAMIGWQKDASLTSVREPEGLVEMSLEEAISWGELWAEVGKLLRQARKGK